jgi:hypothetical protein
MFKRRRIYEKETSENAEEKAISGIRTTTSTTTAAGASFRANIFVTSSAAASLSLFLFSAFY